MPTETAAASHLRLVGQGKACSCPALPDLLGELSCARCGGTLELVHPRERRIDEALTEASRGYMAAQLRWERAAIRHANEQSRASCEAMNDAAMVRDGALQTMRDVLLDHRRIVRRIRGGAR